MVGIMEGKLVWQERRPNLECTPIGSKKCAKQGTRSGYQIWFPEVGTRFGSQKWVPDLVPRSGYQIWSPEVGTRVGPRSA